MIAGKATPIAKMKYEAEVLIAIPNDFKTKNADELMRLEEENLWKFKETGEKYSEKIAYDLLHKALPGMCNGDITELAKVVFDYRFNMGSIENCSFVYEKMIEQANILRKLYENGKCELLTLSSVGPAFLAIVKNDKQKQACKKLMEQIGMNVIETSICNTTYQVIQRKQNDVFWNKEETAQSFTQRPVSKYITEEIEEISSKCEIKKVIDIGCGGGRYSKYLHDKEYDVLAIDKYPQMAKALIQEKIKFKQAEMDNIPTKNEEFDLILSIGVIHNAQTKEEFVKTIQEFYRILQKGKYVILSVFTNDLIADDLEGIGNDIYLVKDKPSMVLLSKEEINTICKENGFIIEKYVEEHVTDVGTGKRNVYTIRLKKANL